MTIICLDIIGAALYFEYPVVDWVAAAAAATVAAAAAAAAIATVAWTATWAVAVAVAVALIVPAAMAVAVALIVVAGAWTATEAMAVVAPWAVAAVVTDFLLTKYINQPLKTADATLNDLVELDMTKYIQLEVWCRKDETIDAYISTVVQMGRKPIMGEYRAAKKWFGSVDERRAETEKLERAREAYARITSRPEGRKTGAGRASVRTISETHHQ